METKTLIIEGMSCQHCVMSLKKELSKLDINIKSIQIGLAEIDYDENLVTINQIKDAVHEAGFSLKNYND